MDSCSRQYLDSTIAAALAEYDDDVRAEWARIRIEPEQWQCESMDELFWVIAIDDDRALWFNHIEDGFTWDRFSSRGTLAAYSANQSEFKSVLDDIARTHGELVRAKLGERDVPAELIGPGSIVRRQTTYWEVRTANDEVYRIHFVDKLEVCFASADYPGIEMAARHPLLMNDAEPIRSLYFSGTPLAPRVVAASLEDAIRDVSATWRGLSDYGYSLDSMESRLRTGHGLLMHAPESICAAVATTLEAAGVGTSILGSVGASSNKRVLVLGRSFVIARAFVFERREPPPSGRS